MIKCNLHNKVFYNFFLFNTITSNSIIRICPICKMNKSSKQFKLFHEKVVINNESIN